MKRNESYQKTSGTDVVNEPAMPTASASLVSAPCAKSNDQYYDRSLETPEFRSWIDGELAISIDQVLHHPEKCTAMTIAQTHDYINSLFSGQNRSH